MMRASVSANHRLPCRFSSPLRGFAFSAHLSERCGPSLGCLKTQQIQETQVERMVCLCHFCSTLIFNSTLRLLSKYSDETYAQSNKTHNLI